MRTGLAPVILLAMLGPLTEAVLRAFEMFQTTLAPVPIETLDPIGEEHLLASVRFAGKGSGVVQLRLSVKDAQAIAQAIGIRFDSTESAGAIDDLVGELANIIGGNLESSLSDAGLPCKLGVPQVVRCMDFHKQGGSGGFCERLGFRNSGLVIFVDVTVNPWNQSDP